MKITVVGAAGGEVTGSAYYVQTVGGFSAHAGQTDLLKWFSALAPSRPRVVLTHGEDEPRRELAKLIQKRFHLPSKLPEMGDVIQL